MMNGIFLRLLPIAGAIPLSLALAGCPDDELLEACTQLCEQRVACDKENGKADTKQGSCETACIPTHGDEFVKRSAECTDKSSCEYVTCADP
jgi:hypothetical protein